MRHSVAMARNVERPFDMSNIPDVVESMKIRLISLDKELNDLDHRKEKALADIKQMKTETSYLQREAELLAERKKSEAQQALLYEEVVLPQLHAELKRVTERVDAKKKHYKETLQKYDEKWEQYLAVYKTFPRVAERDALQNKFNALKIEAARKKQVMIERQRQVQQLEEIQAHQAEILRKQFQTCYSEDEAKRLKIDAIQKEIEERKKRIAEKEAKKQKEEEKQRLEEEEQRKLKESEPQQEPISESVNNKDEQAEKSSGLLPFTFVVPTLKIPRLDDLKFWKSTAPSDSKSFVSLSQGGLSTDHTNQTSRTPLSISLSQPLLKAAFACGFSSGTHKSIQDSVGKLPFTSPSGKNLLADACTSNNVSCLENVTSSLGTKRNNNAVSCEAFSSPSVNNKKEFMLSTDTIVKKLKGTTPRPQLGSSHCTIIDETESPLKASFKQTLHKPGDAQDMVVESSSIHLEETNKPSDDQIVEMNESEHHEQEDQENSEGKAVPCELDDNVNPEQSEQTCNFNQDFDDEDMFNEDLGSPPPFDCMLSPAHASSFDASPPGSINENIKDGGSFSTFGFLPPPSNNIFGGPSASTQEQDNKAKTASPFSFLF